MQINESVLQNLVFKIKMNLGSNHPLYDNLPYYWYCSGPVSETLKESFVKIKKFLTPVDDYFLPESSYEDYFKTHISNEFPEVEKITQKLISKGNYLYYDLNEDIFKQFAPFDMLHEFKYKIFNPTDNNVFSGDGDNYVKSFKNCMVDLYLNHFNNEYNDLFSNFETQIDLLNDENLIEEYRDALRGPIRNLWFTFAQGLRIQAHDEYYTAQCNNWMVIFQNHINQLNLIISQFIYETDDLIDLSKYGKLNESEMELMGSLYDVYLKKG